MVTAWYTLVVGSLLTVNGLIVLLFPGDAAKQPNWYIGLMLIVGIAGLLIGLVTVIRRNRNVQPPPVPTDNRN